MKNYKEMADAVFLRRDEYVAAVKRKKKIALNASLSLCAICLAVVGAIGIWKIGVVEPDPNVIGTKPPYFTDSTEETSKHTLSGSAASEGTYTENTQVISDNRNTESSEGSTQSQTGAETNPPTNTQVTDPVEKATKPTTAVRPVNPTTKPTNPTVKPSTPIVVPTIPLATDPVETPENTEPTWKPAGSDIVEPTESPPETEATYWEPESPARPDGVPETVSPTMPNDAVPDATEATVVVPATTVAWSDAPELPPTSGENTPPTAVPDEPATEAPAAGTVVGGKVVDQNGNPVNGAEIKVYSSGKVVRTYTTGYNGYFYMSGFSDTGDNYVKVTYVPSGYTPANNSANVTDGYNYVVFVCTKN